MRAPAASPAPTRFPTLTLAAIEIPSGTMKLNAARFSTIVCAASSVLPRRPANKVPI